MTVPTSTTKSSWSTQCTRSSDETPTRTGSPSQSTNTENSKVSPAPARNPEVSEKVIYSTRPKVAPGTAHGKHETPSNSDERGKCQKVGNKRRFGEIKNRISVFSNILFNNFSIFKTLSNKNSFFRSCL